MILTFEAVDREFVTSTGRNADTSGTTTRFDGAPRQSKGLVIKSKDGDTDPRLFEVGDVYDITWDGNAIEDAEVIRSDAAGQGGIVGFSGTDANGAPAFVLWTPDFDLQRWYDSVGGRASFYTSDQQPQYTHGIMCFAAEARIETPYGPMPAGMVKPGHRVMTYDDGPQVVRWIGRRRVVGRGDGTPVSFAPGAFGNSDALRLSQSHRVLIGSYQAEVLFGAREVLVPARACVGLPGVSLAPCDTVIYVHLLLDAHHLLCAEHVYCESLFSAAFGSSDAVGSETAMREGPAIRHSATARPVLTFREARVLLGLPPQIPADADHVMSRSGAPCRGGRAREDIATCL